MRGLREKKEKQSRQHEEMARQEPQAKARQVCRMTTILVWYFLSGGYGSNVAVVGPFQTEEQCQGLSKWAYQYKYVSPCYQAPLAAVRPGVEDCRPRTGCQ